MGGKALLTEQVIKDGICPGCGHALHAHVENVLGMIVCMASGSGESTSGVIGIPYHWNCDCKNLVSEEAAREREREAREDEEHDAYWREFSENIKKSMAAKGLKRE